MLSSKFVRFSSSFQAVLRLCSSQRIRPAVRLVFPSRQCSFSTVKPDSKSHRHCLLLRPCSTRSFFQWLTPIFNKYDEEAISEFGPDIAAAQWLLKNGAHVTWKGSGRLLTDYNAIPKDSPKQSKWLIEKIYADDSSISSHGFPYLKHLKHLKEISFVRCHYINNDALAALVPLQAQLTHLEVISCGSVSERGIMGLQMMTGLKYLYLYDLPAVTEKSKCLSLLRYALKGCDIYWPETTGVVGDCEKRLID